MKGVLRYQCERLAVALDLEVVDPHAAAEAGDRRLVQHFRPLVKSSLLIDRLFGSRYQGECLFVTDVTPVASVQQATTGVAARTAIDRVTGTVMEQHFYTTEWVDREICLYGDIRARHPGGILTQHEGDFPCEYALLVAGMLSLDALGGDKSAGLGRCEIGLEPESLRWNGKVISPACALQSFEEQDWAEWIELVRAEMA